MRWKVKKYKNKFPSRLLKGSQGKECHSLHSFLLFIGSQQQIKRNM
jgi:hypothetical protein